MKSILVVMIFTLSLMAGEVELIKPTKLVISSGSECIDSKNDTGCSDIYSAIDMSGIGWLDHLLLLRFSNDNDFKKLSIEQKIKQIREDDKKWLQESTKELLEYESNHGYSSSTIVSFLHQRYNLATIKINFYIYTGGAHGNHATIYEIVDLASKKILSLDNITIAGKKRELASILLQEYEHKYADYGDTFLSPEYHKKLAQMLSDSFYFSNHGITFTYNPYEIAPYSEGVIELELNPHQLSGIIKPEYLK